MKFKWVDSLLQLSDNPPTLTHWKVDEELSLDFKDIYHMQEFLLYVRKQGVFHGMELEKLKKD